MNTYKIQTVLTEDGTVLLKELPFHAGDAVEVIIRSHPKTQQDKIITVLPNLHCRKLPKLPLCPAML
ncbi:MAG: hypothetical protein IM496_09405 [Microcystis sp. M049S2]|uniref:hypothetical protein n=1 Tax=Microcystis sp. M049S2 TaxID=2771169 RepID=UPI00258A7BF3|nr:hypothetical protein [Microcystis sp. M049S2]MCA2658717.1 hypothetical protein [Microcystis sp. M049S2]